MGTKLNITEGISPMPALMIGSYSEDGSVNVMNAALGTMQLKNSFFQIFRNRRYIGEYRYKDIVTPGGIPAIVDKDLFDRVQQRFEQNRIAHGRPAKEDVSYLLTTKLFCGKCGTLMGGESGTSHMGNTYYYYKCGNAKRHGKAHCDLKAIRKEPTSCTVVFSISKDIFTFCE